MHAVRIPTTLIIGMMSNLVKKYTRRVLDGYAISQDMACALCTQSFDVREVQNRFVPELQHDIVCYPKGCIGGALYFKVTASFTGVSRAGAVRA